MFPFPMIPQGKIKRQEMKHNEYSLPQNLVVQDEKTLEGKEHNYCLRCGRKLKNIENRILGYGPVCYEKIRQEHVSKKLF